jgi:hypothetical protein
MRHTIATAVLTLAVAAVTGCSTSSQVNATEATASTQPSAARVRAECPNFRDVIVKQQTPVWCWAASSVMVRKYYDPNDPVTQESLAQQITNVSGDDPKKAKAAGLQQIMVALNPDYSKRVAERSGQLLAQTIQTRAAGGSNALTVNLADVAIGQVAPWSASSDDLIDAVTSKNPAIVGLRAEGASMGHAVVVYAASYEPVQADAGRSAMGQIWGQIVKDEASKRGVRGDQVDAVGVTKGPAKYRLAEVEYVDPMDGKRYKLNAQGFKNRVDFIITKERAREILDRQLASVG